MKVIVIGGYAVRAYTQTRPRYTKDIDLAVQKERDLPKLKGIMRSVGYTLRDRPHGFSGYRKVRGVAITVNAIIESIKSQQRTISSFYPEVNITLKARVASIEDLLVLKTRLWRERDIIDVCLIILDSFDIIDSKRLKERVKRKQFYLGFINSIKKLLNLIGSKKFHNVWEDFMRRKIKKEEERELWSKLNKLLTSITT